MTTRDLRRPSWPTITVPSLTTSSSNSQARLPDQGRTALLARRRPDVGPYRIHPRWRLTRVMSSVRSSRSAPASLKTLVGSGDKIGLFTLPFLMVGLILNVAYPSVFSVGGPPNALRLGSVAVLAVGVVIWAWSAALILNCVPRRKLITHGPYALVKHPLYTAVALMVLPWLGFVLNTWLGVVVGIVMYIGSRVYAPAEDAELARTFGSSWAAYAKSVKIPWL
jgi:protein-S-isoprenylcysteine O-methyltransferase Ste14